MPNKEQEALRDLLTSFNAAALGQGDPAAGANLLAAMACDFAPAAGAAIPPR